MNVSCNDCVCATLIIVHTFSYSVIISCSYRNSFIATVCGELYPKSNMYIFVGYK